MNRALIALSAAVLFSTAASAGELSQRPTLLFGYQNAMINDFGHIDGPNVKFQYETPSAFGIMGSVSAMKKDWGKGTSQCKKRDWNCKVKERKNRMPIRNAEYYSVLIGPTYRIADSISLFALGGMSHTKVDKPLSGEKKNHTLKAEGAESSNNFAYSVGVVINPTDNLAVSTGYEGSRAAFNKNKHDINSMFMSIGYRF